jgi:triosephosphate isomerase
MKKSLYLIANWKMYFSHTKALELFLDFQQHFSSPITHHKLVICPPISTLASIPPLYNRSERICLGAQTCSAYDLGAHTGDIDAQSLQELNYAYCIVGHSERRASCSETNELVAQQTYQLLKHAIIPIVCVGETAQERSAGITKQIITDQLKAVFAKIHHITIRELLIAYEPRWAIGSDQTPENDEIQEVFTHIHDIAQHYTMHQPLKVIYGGSVDASTINHLKNIPLLDGFLIGRASTHQAQLFQIIKNLDS